MGILEGKKILVTGVLTEASIAFTAARLAQEEGAEVLLSSFGRMLPITQKIAERLPKPVKVIELDATNQDNWVPVFAAAASGPATFAYPSTGYPILGFTNLIFSQCYADATQSGQVRDFFARHYGATTNNDAAITANRFVPLPTAWKTAIRTTFVTASNTLSIGNTNVCNGIGRPL